MLSGGEIVNGLRVVKGARFKLWIDGRIVSEVTSDNPFTLQRKNAQRRPRSWPVRGSVQTVLAGNEADNLTVFDQLISHTGIAALDETSHGTAVFSDVDADDLGCGVEKGADEQCILVLIGARPQGKKELIGLQRAIARVPNHEERNMASEAQAAVFGSRSE
jgi:hypothetical protein